jgi:hypothetical protein
MWLINCAFVGQRNFDIIEMHGTTIKIIDAQQAKLRNTYKNTKLKLLKTNAAIWFNKFCKIRQLKPNYINIKINGRSKYTDVLTVNFNILYG